MDKDKQKLLNEAGEHILNTCENDTYVAEEFNVTVEELLEHLSEQGIERCEVCEWWCDSFEEREGYDFICTECSNSLGEGYQGVEM